MNPTTAADPRQNRLLAELDDDELAQLLPHLEHVSLPLGFVVVDVDRPIEHVYFPDSALVSMLGADDTGAAVEVAMVGRDGMSGIQLLFGIDRTLAHSFVQVAGECWRMPADAFRRALESSPTFDRVLRRYAHVLFFFASQSSACNRLHDVQHRCARWLLTTQDAVGSDQFRLTHRIIAQMLGVRRATVTEAAGLLQRDGAISYSRGVVRIENRAALLQRACSCYGLIRRERERVLLGRDDAGLATLPPLSEDGTSTAGERNGSSP